MTLSSVKYFQSSPYKQFYITFDYSEEVLLKVRKSNHTSRCMSLLEFCSYTVNIDSFYFQVHLPGLDFSNRHESGMI